MLSMRWRCLLTPGLSKDIGTMYNHAFLCACKSPGMKQTILNVEGQSGDCRWPVNLHQGFVWVCMS